MSESGVTPEMRAAMLNKWLVEYHQQFRKLERSDENALEFAYDKTRERSDQLAEALEESAKDWDKTADMLDNWARESRRGGWSTHQVQANEKEADQCRRRASLLRGALAAYRGGKG